MSPGWIISIVAVVLAAAAVWAVLLATSIVVPPGTLALLLKRGKATDRALTPGRHFMQPWRKAMVQVYPSRELALVAGGASSPDPRVEAYDDPLHLQLGDRTEALVSYTVRANLDLGQLRTVHDRFGPDGVWGALRDITRDALISEFREREISIGDVFGEQYTALADRLERRLASSLSDAGFILRMFTLRQIDLGETGAVIQGALRADAELERERAMAKVRAARLENDAAMSELVAGIEGDVLLRYRQLEIWRETLERWDGERSIPTALTVAMTTTPPPVYEGEARSGQDAAANASEAGTTAEAP